ncbi:NAD-dependent malic enzyme [Kluyvera cryocrescens]|uniref:NAD-dependent malic enzyme n=1 Tax=Kluyvera cryocrescens TaxID=580 RepID=A0A485CTK4_KLUCR|nr:NAD-dependent malic enzyme [Kluyvera cryocrescens]
MLSGNKNRSLYIPYAGPVLLEFPLLNKGSAFSMEERSNFNLLGLLPEVVETIEEQAERAWIQYQGFKTEIDKHIYLRNIQDTNETLFYRLVENHLDEMMPVIYTRPLAQPASVSPRSTVARAASSSRIRIVTIWTIFCKTCQTITSKSLW